MLATLMAHGGPQQTIMGRRSAIGVRVRSEGESLHVGRIECEDPRTGTPCGHMDVVLIDRSRFPAECRLNPSLLAAFSWVVLGQNVVGVRNVVRDLSTAEADRMLAALCAEVGGREAAE